MIKRFLAIWQAIFIAGLGGVMLSGCQTAGDVTLVGTLEEAQNITARFSGSSVKPPPRSTADLLKLLEETQPDTIKIQALKNKADAPINTAASRRHVAFAYMRRSRAASKAGRSQQSLVDIRKAMDVAQGLEIRNGRREIMRRLALAEAEVGNYTDAVSIMKQAIADQNGRSIGSHQVLAQIYAEMGHLDKAKEYTQRSKFLEARARGRRNRKDPTALYREPMNDYYLAFAAGRLVSALSFLAKSIDIFKARSRKGFIPNWVEKRELQMVEVLRRQGNFVAAEATVRKVLLRVIRKQGKTNLITAQTLHALSIVLLNQGRYGEAAKVALKGLEVLRLLEVPSTSITLRYLHHDLGKALVAEGRWQEAQAAFSKARGPKGTDDFLSQKLFANDPDVAMALIKTGRRAEAKRLLSAAIPAMEENLGGDSYDAAEMKAIMAVATAEGGAGAKAITLFRDALPVLSGQSGTRGSGGMTPGVERRRAVILETYLAVLAATGGGSSAEEAFRVAEIARGGIVQLALAASAFRAAASTPELSGKVRDYQDALRQIESLMGYLAKFLAVPASQRDNKAMEHLHDRIKGFNQTVKVVAEELAQSFPDFAELVRPKLVTVPEVRKNLLADEAFISTYVGQEKSYVWAFGRNGKLAFAVVERGDDNLSLEIAELRLALEPQVETLGEIPDFNVKLAHGLYQDIFAPVSAGWSKAKSIIFLAHGPLGRLPVSLLPLQAVSLGGDEKHLFDRYRKVPWLAKKYAVTMIPSAASFRLQRALAGKPVGDRRPFVGFGDPVFGAAQKQLAQAQTTRGGIRFRSKPRTRQVDSATLALLPRLPDTADEITSIAAALGANSATDVFLGVRANEDRVKQLSRDGHLARYRIISFATHGLVAGDLDGLAQPALALSSPGVTGGKEDGLLTMGEILGLRLNADWAVLSACNTASAEGKGAEAVSGLGRAFFFAGARALLVSSWPVYSAATKDLMTTLFGKQAADAHVSRAEALRQTRVRLIDEMGFKDEKGQMVFAYAHPIFWAPFVLVGDGSGQL